eukprot:symbB.v1.2.010584.t3/scaffold686.1/size316167/3
MKAEWSEKWSATKEEWGDEDWGDGWDDEDWGDEDWGGEWEEGWRTPHCANMRELRPFIDAHVWATETSVKLKLFEKKRLDEQWYRDIKDLWTGPGTHVGQLADTWPSFEKGTVIGIDVDMNDGSLAFWGNGKFLGVVKDNEGKPVNLKGKKVVPAMSVFGRDIGNFKENTIMEIRTGLDAPARP